VSDDLLLALQNPDVYDHPVINFRLIQTHISWVLLTGEYAYKIKKPANFGFLDFSSLAQRKYYCEQELRLNRRTASGIYLDVVAILGPPEAPFVTKDPAKIQASSANIIEYAVKMRQFDPEASLERLLDDEDKLASQLDKLAVKIADFHQHHALQVAADSPFGTAAEIFAPVQQNFEQIRPLLTGQQERVQLDYLEGWAKATYQCLRDKLEDRKRDGFVRECHGDMHLGNVTLIDNEATLFDCIEFNESFRCIDVLNDLAFLLMDLDDQGLRGLSARTRNLYLEQTGDYAGLYTLKFYKAYRAMVRCKIALFTMTSTGLAAEDVAREGQKYKRYLQLAERYMNVPVPFLMIMHGVAGTGKSTVSSYLLQHLGAIRVRSDVARKMLHGLKPLDRSNSDIDSGIYTADASEQTYRALEKHADCILRAGYPVILDATFLKLKYRQQMQELAENRGVPFVIIDCQAPMEDIEQRIEIRQAKKTDAAEADVKVMHRQLSSEDPLTPLEYAHVVQVSSQDLAALDQLAAQLAERVGVGY